MAKRPTIPDLARAAGVSVSTVNRVINDACAVRQPTRERVLDAAERIGFYGLGALEFSIKKNRELHRLGILLLQGNRSFYRDLGKALERAADALPDETVELTIEFLDDLSPDNVAMRLIGMSEKCEAIALVAPQHPLISDAIDAVLDKGVSVCALIAALTARRNVGFVGLDYWKAGRTAAWAFDNICKEPGKIGILVGNHRYRNQKLSESGFRSYFREHNSKFTLLEPRSTYESSAVAWELTEQLFSEHPEMCGLYVSGGGVTGVLAALRENSPKNERFVSVGYDLFDATRTGLIDGDLTLVISHPLEALARETIGAMIRSKKAGPTAGAQNVTLSFEVYTRENL